MRKSALAGAVLAICLIVPAPVAAQHDHHDDAMSHIGNAAPYPDVTAASRANRRKLRRLRLSTLREAPRFDTVAEATALGYVSDARISPIYRPGLQHYRARGTRFWGRLLNARRPHALVFWCPSVGECALASFMYRAAPTRMPATYGRLLGWHRHGPNGSWMTHVWLTPSLRSALAQCAPFNALHVQNQALSWESYQVDVPMVDAPCPDTVGLSG